jgi:hypothetical protein
MADDIDRTNDYIEKMLNSKISGIRDKATLGIGKQGECDFCGEWMVRLISGACPPCRDRYKLP